MAGATANGFQYPAAGDAIADYPALAHALADLLELRLKGNTLKRSIRGSVSGAGALVAGTGFTVSRSSAGIYLLVITAPFPVVPIVMVTPTGPAGVSAPVAYVVAAAAGSFGVNTYASNTSTSTDAPFHFVAWEP